MPIASCSHAATLKLWLPSNQAAKLKVSSMHRLLLLASIAALLLTSCATSSASKPDIVQCPVNMTATVQAAPRVPDTAAIPKVDVMTPEQKAALADYLAWLQGYGRHDAEMTARAQDGKTWCDARAAAQAPPAPPKRFIGLSF